MKIPDKVTDEQLEIIKATEGYIRVASVPGSGKTFVLTYRIAYLITELYVDPASIVALTFTNKAAGEMKQRLKEIIGDKCNCFAGTFHGYCNKILKDEIHRLSFPKTFSILDKKAELDLIREVAEEVQVSLKQSTARKMMDEMDKKKLDTSYIELMTSEDTTQIDARLETENNAVERGRLLSVLSGRFGNLFVVGDDDQNIYSWRGSNPEYMIHFHEDYPEVKSYQLTENFRSTPQVVELAKALIIQNKNRLKKDMFTRNSPGAKPVFNQLKTEKEESAWIANSIGREMEQGKSIRIL